MRRLLKIPGEMGPLAATLEYPESRPSEALPLVIMLHALMMDSREPVFERIASRLHALGIATLRFDFAGHGLSAGAFEDMTIPGQVADAQTALGWARSLPDIPSVELLGHSQGGLVASQVAGARPHDVDALVLMAPAAILVEQARRGRIAGSRFDPEHIPAYISCFGARVKGAYARTAQNIDVDGAARSYDGPTCLIHGTSDRLVPARVSRRYHDVYEHSELHLPPRVGHEFMGNSEDAIQLATDFLARNLI